MNKRDSNDQYLPQHSQENVRPHIYFGISTKKQDFLNRKAASPRHTLAIISQIEICLSIAKLWILGFFS